jgi:hypothetical protein
MRMGVVDIGVVKQNLLLNELARSYIFNEMLLQRLVPKNLHTTPISQLSSSSLINLLLPGREDRSLLG